MQFQHFRVVRFINNKNEGVAKSHAGRKELVINRYYFDKLPKEHQLFVLAHEEGHIALNTRNELAADEYASKKYLAAGYSLTESVKALTSILEDHSPEHIVRAWLQYQRALQYDYEKNGNKKTYRPFYETSTTIKKKLQNMYDSNGYDHFSLGQKIKERLAAPRNTVRFSLGDKINEILNKNAVQAATANSSHGNYSTTLSAPFVPSLKRVVIPPGALPGRKVELITKVLPPLSFTDRAPSEEINTNDYDGFLGIAIGKRARKRKQKRFDMRMATKDSKNQARIELAKHGVQMKSGVAQVVGGIASAASSIFGGGGGGSDDPMGQIPQTYPTYNPIPETAVPYQNTIGNAQQAVQQLPPASYEPYYVENSRGGYAENPAYEKKDGKNKNLPFIIGGVVLLLIVVMFAMKKK